MRSLEKLSDCSTTVISAFRACWCRVAGTEEIGRDLVRNDRFDKGCLEVVGTVGFRVGTAFTETVRSLLLPLAGSAAASEPAPFKSLGL